MKKVIIISISIVLLSCKKEEVKPNYKLATTTTTTNQQQSITPKVDKDTIIGEWEFEQYNYLNGVRDQSAGIEYLYNFVFTESERTITWSFFDEWGQPNGVQVEVNEIRNLTHNSYEYYDGVYWVSTNYRFINNKLYIEENSFSEMPLTKQ